MEPVPGHPQEDQDGARRRDRFAREREEDLPEGSTRRDDCTRDPGLRSSRKRSPSVGRGGRDDDRRLKRRRSISPRGGSYRASRNDSDRYIPSYVRDGYSSSRSRFPGQDGAVQSPMMGAGYPDPGVNKLTDPLDFNYLIPPSQFAEYLMAEARLKNPRGTFSVNPAELERRYGIYRENFINKQQETFFNMEKNSEWVRERYHPTDSIPLKKEVAQRRQGLLNILKENLESGLYDTICYDEPANIVSKPGILQDEKTEDSDCKDSAQSGGGQQDNLTQAQDKNGISENQQKETTISQEGLNRHISYDLSLFKASDPSTNALFIRAVPPSIKRAAIVDMCSQIQGFKYLCLSDPKPEKDMHRLGWIIFDKNTDMEAAYRAFDGQTLDNFTFHVQSHRDMDQRVRLINPDSNTKERLEKDLGQIMELTKVLEEEADIPENSGTSMIEERVSKILGHPAGNQEETQAAEHQNEEDNSASIKRTKLLLDIHITYLRCVHQYDYYSSIECMSPEDFCRKSFIYFRRSSTDKFFKKAWAEQLDFKIRLRITKPYTGPEILKIGGKTLDIDLDKSLSKHVKKEGEGKRRCRQCGKLFKAEQFVRKHIKLKHSGIANAIEEEIKYFDNFVRDQQRADSFRYYLNAGGSIVNLGMRNQSQMGQNLLMSGVVPQLPGILSMMPNQIPGMNKNINIAALNMLMMNLSRIRQQTSAMGGMYPGVIPRQQQAPLLSDRNPQYPPGDQGDAYQLRSSRERIEYRSNSSRSNINYRDLDAAEYDGDLKIVYD